LPYSVKEETLQSLQHYCRDEGRLLIWPVIFTLPVWIGNWWEHFGLEKYQLLIRSVWMGDELIGIAPLMRDGAAARLIGSADVCDYLDFVTASGRESDFFAALLPALAAEGIEVLELESQRPEAAVFKGFFAGSAIKGSQGRFTLENESSEIILADEWEDYLMQLNKKQRHEVRRKLRKLENETVSNRFRVSGEVQGDSESSLTRFTPQFIDLFLENPEKADFLTDKMKKYFHGLITATAAAGLARFGLLEIDGEPAAAVLFFSYDGRIYLYNSGYRSDYSNLSAGLLSKVLCIKDSIERGRQVFDFLKGPEIYKSRLGGVTIPIYKVTLQITQ